MTSPDNSTQIQPLNVVVVGAGVAGLAVTIALRRNGHHVQIFESADKLAEIGAAISVPINCQRVLEHLGYSKENLNSVNFDGLVRFDAASGESATSRWLIPAVNEKPNILCHRSDLHAELERLALGPSQDDTPVTLHLESKVVGCETETGFISLSDGRRIQSDLVIGADGISSTMRTAILGHAQKSISCGLSCYRALIDMSKLQGPEFAWLRDGIAGPRNVVKRGGPFRMLFMYPCQGGALLNFAAFFEDPHQDSPNWTGECSRSEVQAVFADFHPQFQLLLAALGERVLKWKLRTIPALPTWVRGRAAIIGDAAHATLPTLGQGAAVAIEEAGVLGVLFPAGTAAMDVPARLAAYEAFCKQRGEFVGRESLEQALVATKFGEYNRSKEMQEYMLGYDAIGSAEKYFQARFGAGN
ncbi:FAD/NAD(P)-binding domain-containing protein [Mycena epipterygia]|nr:FAD/NAD(P)-binding domain-containing protein [Mycena epipterygia]